MNDLYDCMKTGFARPKSGRCIHEACRPQGPISEELKRMDQVVLPHYTATLNIRRADGEEVVSGIITGPATAVALAVRAVADAFEEEVER